MKIRNGVYKPNMRVYMYIHCETKNRFEIQRYMLPHLTLTIRNFFKMILEKYSFCRISYFMISD